MKFRVQEHGASRPNIDGQAWKRRVKAQNMVITHGRGRKSVVFLTGGLRIETETDKSILVPDSSSVLVRKQLVTDRVPYYKISSINPRITIATSKMFLIS
jgi:hypothetical protein